MQQEKYKNGMPAVDHGNLAKGKQVYGQQKDGEVQAKQLYRRLF